MELNDLKIDDENKCAIRIKCDCEDTGLYRVCSFADDVFEDDFQGGTEIILSRDQVIKHIVHNKSVYFAKAIKCEINDPFKEIRDMKYVSIDGPQGRANLFFIHEDLIFSSTH